MAITGSKWRINLSGSVFIYATLLIGDPKNDFIYSRDWNTIIGTSTNLST